MNYAALSPPSAFLDLQQTFNEAMGAADAANALIDQTNPVPVFCYINYFPG